MMANQTGTIPTNKTLEPLPLCTVMIPTYNQAAYLRRTIDSALSQEYPNLEVIVADDASTDGTAELLAGYSDSRLRWHTNRPNLGRVANYRDLLVNHAKGEWVVNLDGDDFFIDPTFIGSAIRATRKNPGAVIVFADRREMPDPIAEIPETRNAATTQAETVSGMDYIRSWPKTKKRIHHLTAVYNRAKALDTGFYTENIISSDYDSLFRLMAHGDIVHLPAKVAVWRFHSQNASTNKTVTQKIDDLRWLEHVCEYVSAQKSNYAGTMRRWLRKNVAHRYYGYLLSMVRSGDRAALKSLEKELDARYPGVRARVLASPIIWFKLARHALGKRRP